MDMNYDVTTFVSNTFIFRKLGVAIFADIIKIVSLKTPEKLKKLEIMYQNEIYTCISWCSKICWFPVKNCWFQQNSSGVSRDSYFLEFFLGKV